MFFIGGETVYRWILKDLYLNMFCHRHFIQQHQQGHLVTLLDWVFSYTFCTYECMLMEQSSTDSSHTIGVHCAGAHACKWQCTRQSFTCYRRGWCRHLHRRRLPPVMSRNKQTMLGVSGGTVYMQQQKSNQKSNTKTQNTFSSNSCYIYIVIK